MFIITIEVNKILTFVPESKSSFPAEPSSLLPRNPRYLRLCEVCIHLPRTKS